MTELKFINVSKSFGDKAVLKNFSLTLPAGERLCIMGRSGCGKTTVLSLASGLLRPDSGEIAGVPKRISAVFQEDRLCEDFSAVSNIRLVCGKNRPDGEIRAALGRLGLSGSEDAPVRELSGGMKRRVAIARVMLFDSGLILLDEAFKGLDGATKELAVDFVLDFCAGRSVLYVTHDEAEAGALGGGLLKMEPLVSE